MKARLAAALGAVVLVLVAASSAAAAAAVKLRDVDARNFPVVSMSVLVDGPAPKLTDFHLRENGEVVETFDVAPLAQTGTPVGTVLVIDTSGSMAEAGKLEAAKAAARQFVAQKVANDLIALVAFSNTSRVVVDFTADAAALRKGIDSLAPKGETALWDAVRASAGLFAKRPELQANVVLLTDGQNSIPGVTLDQARAAAASAHAAVFAVGLGDATQGSASLNDLAAPTGGRYVAANDAKALAGIYDGIGKSLRNQYRIRYTSHATGNVDVDVTAGIEHATGSFEHAGAVVAPPPAAEHTGSGAALNGTAGRLIAGGLVFVAVALTLLFLALHFLPDRPTMESMISPYGEDADAVPDDPQHIQMAETSFLQRAVAATEKLAEERGFLGKIEATLAQADAPLRAAEAFFFSNAATLLAGILVYVLLRSFIATVATLAIGVFGPLLWLKLRIGRRKRKFLAQLPDTLQLLAGSLRAGYSLLQGVETVAHEIRDPMGKELSIVLTEARLGRPLEEALQDAASRMGSADFDWVVMAIGIQREVGGNLAELLSTVSETMIARQRLRREVRALTAEGRMTALILAFLPIAIGVALYFLNPSYMNVLFTRTIGKVMLAGSGVWACLGFAWMQKIIKVDA